MDGTLDHLPLDADGLNQLELLPGTAVTVVATTETLTRASTAQEVWEIVRIHQFKEFFLVVASEYFDLVPGLFI